MGGKSKTHRGTLVWNRNWYLRINRDDQHREDQNNFHSKVHGESVIARNGVNG